MTAFAELSDDEYDQQWFHARGFRDEDALRACINDIGDWDEPTARARIRRLLIQSGTLGVDESRWQTMQLGLDSPEYNGRKSYNEYSQRLHVYYEHKSTHDCTSCVAPPWEGITWILDLLPADAETALQGLEAYHCAHAMVLPDGRWAALEDAAALIKARYLGVPQDPEENLRTLRSVSPRTLEIVVSRLYSRMGYEVELTQASKDGGRDVVATSVELGRRERLLIECKQVGKPVGVELVRQLLGVVAAEIPTRGVLITTSSFTAGAIRLGADHRLELIDGRQLVDLLDRYLGPRWPLNWRLIEAA
ncbi:restriction endonuclease [Catellatospora paridis]|uniref:restriction endonuclease n=1 Tax=Catellatospora paridis TaxID=1617086 RepID=UPI0012D43E08|nr:restriction endonuclease [Catellatospora paridis]